MIVFEHVYKSFQQRSLFADFNLTINDGECVCIVGTSGCGKTTLLNLINATLTADAGSITINGQSLDKKNVRTARLGMGYALQSGALFPHLSVYENIVYVLTLQRIKPAIKKQRALELLTLVGLDSQLLTRYPHELSGGQQQRVGIARALANNPSILLLDEPFGAVDKITRQHLQKQLQHIHQTLKQTIVFVTHDIEEACLLSDRILILDQGIIQQFDTKEAIMSHPANDFVRALIA